MLDRGKLFDGVLIDFLMTIVIPTALIVGVVLFVNIFQYKEGKLGFVANLLRYLWRKFYKLVLIILIAYIVLSFIFNVLL